MLLLLCVSSCMPSKCTATERICDCLCDISTPGHMACIVWTCACAKTQRTQLEGSGGQTSAGNRPRSGSCGPGGGLWLCRSPKGISTPASSPSRNMVRELSVASAHLTAARLQYFSRTPADARSSRSHLRQSMGAASVQGFAVGSNGALAPTAVWDGL